MFYILILQLFSIYNTGYKITNIILFWIWRKL